MFSALHSPIVRSGWVLCVALLSWLQWSRPLAAWQNQAIEFDVNQLTPGPMLLKLPETASTQTEWCISNLGNLPVQWVDRENRQVAMILPPGSHPRRLKIEPDTRNRNAWPSVQVREVQDPHRLSISIGANVVMEYPLATVMPPPKIDAVFAHSGHIHPLKTPAGHIVTAEFPADHAHQHGIFRAWVNTSFQGKKVDFWNQKERTGHVEHEKLMATQSGPIVGQATVSLIHSALQDGKKIPVLRDTLTFRVWNVAERHIVDIESHETCIADQPLTVHQYHYGGMAFRGREEWLGKEGARLTTNELKNRVEGNHTRPNWVAIEGKLGEAVCHVIAMSHPNNFRGPEPVRLHPDKPYFVFSPPVLGEFIREPGESRDSHYRYIASDGPLEPPTVDQWHAAYSATNPWRK